MCLTQTELVSYSCSRCQDISQVSHPTFKPRQAGLIGFCYSHSICRPHSNFCGVGSSTSAPNMVPRKANFSEDYRFRIRLFCFLPRFITYGYFVDSRKCLRHFDSFFYFVFSKKPPGRFRYNKAEYKKRNAYNSADNLQNKL